MKIILDKSIELKYYSFGNLNPDKNFYIIWRASKVGYFSNVFHVLGHILYAEKLNMIPIVDMENFPTFYNDSEILATKNAWEYHFHQISPYSLEEVYSSKNVYFSTGKFNSNIYKKENFENCHRLIHTYIKPKNTILSKLQNYQKVFSDNTVLAVHLRGQDRKYAVSHEAPPSLEQVIEAIDSMLNKYPIDKIFLATDEQNYLETLTERYRDKIFYIESDRANFIPKSEIPSKMPHLHTLSSSKYQLGEDVMLDAYLLAEADYLIASGKEGIASGSNISRFSQYLKKEYLDSIFIYNGINPDPAKANPAPTAPVIKLEDISSKVDSLYKKIDSFNSEQISTRKTQESIETAVNQLNKQIDILSRKVEDSLNPTSSFIALKNIILSPYYKKKAFELVNSEKVYEAELIAQNFITNNPKISWAYYILGKCQWKQGQPELASKSIQKAIDIDPSLEYYKVYLRSIQKKQAKQTCKIDLCEQNIQIHTAKDSMKHEIESLKEQLLQMQKTLTKQEMQFKKELQHKQEAQSKENASLKKEIDFFKSWQTDFYKDIPEKFPIALSEKEIETLITYFQKSQNYLEFGAGGSTFLALLHSECTVHTVESDLNWIDSLRSWNIIQEKERSGRVVFHHANIGATGAWGFPIDEANKELFPNYSKSVFAHSFVPLLDTVYIDGRFRVACTLATIMHCNKDVIIMIHDFPERPYYHVVKEFLDIVDQVDTLVICRIKNNIDMQQIAEYYEQYKYICE